MQQDLFSQPNISGISTDSPLPPSSVFPEHHGRENNSASESLYENNMVRLSRNTRVLLWAMIEGAKLTGLDIVKGVSNSATDKPVVMTEYRKRFQEIIRAGVNLQVKTVDGKFNQWSIAPEDQLFYRIKFRGLAKS